MSFSSSSKRPLAVAAGVAAVLATCAYIVKRKSSEAEAQNPPQGRFVSVQGVALHVIEHGSPSAPVLVLLHGNGVMAIEMELSGLVDQAASRFRVLVFDRPGYGHSNRPDGHNYTPQVQAELLWEALDQMGVQRPTVLGHSWGALVAGAMAEQRPQSLKAVILVSGYYTPGLRFDVPWMSLPALPLLGTLMRHTVSPLLSRALWPLMLKRLFGPAAVTTAFKTRYPVWMSLRPGQIKASAAETAMMIPAAMRVLRSNPEDMPPTVIVAGESDRLLGSQRHSGRLSRRLPDSQLHLVPHAGHMVHHTATDAVMRAIDQGLAMARE